MWRRDVVEPVEARGAARWVPFGLTVVACVAALLAQPRSSPRRVAIRVACQGSAACALVEALAVDVWSEQRGPGLPLDAVVPEDALATLAAAHVAWQVLVPDIDEAARVEAARLHDPVAARPADWFGEFRDYGAISARLQELAELAPDRVAVQVIGGSVEGRPLWAVRIGHGPTRMLIDGTQHAREWIAAMVTTCVADRLVRGYATDPEIRAFVDRTELWVVPVVNPDGYQFAWSSNRYWRKNRRGGHGVDLNRNFSVAWGGTGASGNERSETYRGLHAFSEPESAALRDLVKREQFALHIDFHTYGQLVLYPWSYTYARAKDRDRFAGVGDRLASAIYAAHQTRYELKPGAALYPASGTMMDWMYGEASALSYTIELRPKGGSGFVLPPEQIRPTCDEGLAAVLELRKTAD
jgi:carboxypeptidase T